TEDGTLVNATSVLANDVHDDPVHLTAVNGSAANIGTQLTLASGALLTVHADGTYDYNPNGAFETLTFGNTATDSFTYSIADGHGDTSTATVTITITQPDHPATAVNDSYNLNENATLHATTVLANDTNIDADGVTAQLVSGVAHGTLSFNADGTFTYTPTTGYFGTDSFTYKDIGDGVSNTATVTLNIAAVDQGGPTGII